MNQRMNNIANQWLLSSKIIKRTFPRRQKALNNKQNSSNNHLSLTICSKA